MSGHAWLGAADTRARLQRAAVRFTERREAGAPGDVVELEAAAVAAVRAGAGVDPRLALAAGQVLGADPSLGEVLARWVAVGVDLAALSPEYFARAIVAAEHHTRERRRGGDPTDATGAR